MRRRMIVSILTGLTLILSTFFSTVSIVQKIAYAQARMEPSMNGVPVPNSMTQRSMVVGSNTEPGRNSAVQGVAGALISDGRSITNGPHTFEQGTHSVEVSKIATAVQKISIAVGAGLVAAAIYDLKKYAQSRQNLHLGQSPNIPAQYSRTETLPSTASQLGIAHAQGIVRDPALLGTQGADNSPSIRDPQFAAALSSVGLSITNGPQVLAQGTHSVDTSMVLQKITTLLVDISLVAGVGFIVAGFFKFHQHKQNPQQVHISQEVLLLLESIHLFS
jgi:hypothetical protein